MSIICCLYSRGSSDHDHMELDIHLSKIVTLTLFDNVC